MTKTKIAENIARLYHNCINEQGHSSNVRESSDGHNLRNQLEMRNVINEKTKNNILYINGQKVDPLNTENNYNLVQETCNDLKKSFQDEARKNDNDVTLSAQRKAKLQTDRTKLKAKLKKWSDSPKAEPDEKEFFNNLYNDIGNKELKSDDLISELQKMGKSVKRFNDKKKAISGLDKLNDLLGTSSININLSLITKEVVYKVPEQWEQTIKANDFFKISRAINKKFYPDFDPIYETVHMDEQSPHVHVRLSGMNNKTKQFDMQNTLLNRVRHFDKENRLPENKKYSQLNKEETKLFGEIYQEQVFYLFNKHLKTLKYDFKVEKRTPEEKKDDFKKFKDKTKKIADREYNLQNHLSEKNEAANKELNKTNELIFENDETIEDQKLDINRNKKEIISGKEELKSVNHEIVEAKSKLQEIKDLFADGLKNAVEYAIDKLPLSLQNYIENQRMIDELKIESGNDLHKKAIDIQPDEQQKNKVRGSRLRR